MVRVAMHGLRVEYDASTSPWDPIGSFLGHYPAIAAGPVDLRIDVRPVSAPSAQRADLVPFFFHGNVQVYRSGRGAHVSGDGVRAEVASDASIIEVEATPTADLEDVRRAVHVALLWALRARSLFDLHAAAVVPDGSGRAVVIVGDSGSGKTTLTLAFLEAGFGYLGDDRVLLRHRATTDVLSYPRAFHVGEATLDAFPRLAAYVGSPTHDRKRAFEPGLAYPSAAGAHSAAPALLLCPTITEAPQTSWRSLSQSEAFGPLLVSSAMLAVEGMPDRDANLAALRDLASSVPAFEVLLGRDVLASPRDVARVIADLPQRGG